MLDEPVFEEDGARFVGGADAFEVGLGQACGDVAGVGGDLAFEIVAGALVDLVGHDALEQQMAFAAEFEHLRVGQGGFAVAGVIGFVVDHWALLGGFPVPVNLA